MVVCNGMLPIENIFFFKIRNEKIMFLILPSFKEVMTPKNSQWIFLWQYNLVFLFEVLKKFATVLLLSAKVSLTSSTVPGKI